MKVKHTKLHTKQIVGLFGLYTLQKNTIFFLGHTVWINYIHTILG